jgi:hypothetical protein
LVILEQAVPVELVNLKTFALIWLCGSKISHGFRPQCLARCPITLLVLVLIRQSQIVSHKWTKGVNNWFHLSPSSVLEKEKQLVGHSHIHGTSPPLPSIFLSTHAWQITKLGLRMQRFPS